MKSKPAMIKHEEWAERGTIEDDSSTPQTLDDHIAEAQEGIDVPVNPIVTPLNAAATLDAAHRLLEFLNIITVMAPEGSEHLLMKLRQVVIDAVGYASALIALEDEMRNAATP